MSAAELILGFIDHQYYPPLLFSMGMVASFTCCAMVLFLEMNLRTRAIDPDQSGLKSFSYQRFRKELVSFPRHLGFALGDVQELEDHAFHPNRE